jgi:hypothetical protein
MEILEKQKEQKSIESVATEVTKDKDSAIKFLKSAGIMDYNGELAEMYRSEQKPADYDHEMWKNCVVNFEGGKKEVIEHPERYGLQKPAERNEFEQALQNALLNARKIQYVDAIENSIHDTAKAILELAKKEQKPAEWSEEDEETLGKLHRLLVICRGEKKFIKEADYNKMDNLLKSLRPQPHWKPSNK